MSQRVRLWLGGWERSLCLVLADGNLGVGWGLRGGSKEKGRGMRDLGGVRGLWWIDLGVRISNRGLDLFRGSGRHCGLRSVEVGTIWWRVCCLLHVTLRL